MTEVLETGNFVRRVRSLMRVGEFSRERIDVVRIEVRGNEAECDWVTRPVDAWDIDIPRSASERNYSQQVLLDGLQMREILFSTFTRVGSAEFRAYQRSDNDTDLVMTGTVYRDDEEPSRSVSTIMRAKLLGFHFLLIDGSLVPLNSECTLPSSSMLQVLR